MGWACVVVAVIRKRALRSVWTQYTVSVASDFMCCEGIFKLVTSERDVKQDKEKDK